MKTSKILLIFHSKSQKIRKIVIHRYHGSRKWWHVKSQSRSIYKFWPWPITNKILFQNFRELILRTFQVTDVILTLLPLANITFVFLQCDSLFTWVNFEVEREYSLAFKLSHTFWGQMSNFALFINVEKMKLNKYYTFLQTVLLHLS